MMKKIFEKLGEFIFEHILKQYPVLCYIFGGIVLLLIIMFFVLGAKKPKPEEKVEDASPPIV